MATNKKNQSDFEFIVDALGGVFETARAIGRRPTQICQWRKRYGRFPAETYFIVQAALKRAGYKTCPRDAFRFDEVTGRAG